MGSQGTVKSGGATYQVLARKWRPQRFADVVGQEHITRTLQNAILQDRVGHAYLFVGPRGIGKTTSARIFAKALNCQTGVVPEPCCECQSCREITAGTSLDVIEIDGASHNKVEDIRDIRDNVQYTPSRSRYKIYIIDEVHMLSPAAWNALLKTLEEPPPHVKFLFATTEAHKVLPTIVSRCQRFDLRRIPVPLIVRRLTEIATAENVRIEERAVAAIARAADGGMRDAQSIFDQIISFCGGQEDGVIGEHDVIDVFGLASGAELQQLAQGMLGNDVAAVMRVVQGLADRGRDLERLFGDVVALLRNLLVLQLCRTAEDLLEVSESEMADLRGMAQSAGPDCVQQVLDSLLLSEGGFRAALNKRIYLEVILIRAMRDGHSVPIDDLLARLGDLRRGGAAAPRPPPALAPPPTIPPAAPVRPPAAPAAAVAAPTPAPTPAGAGSETARTPAPAPVPAAVLARTAGEPRPDTGGGAPATPAKTAAAAVAPARSPGAPSRPTPTVPPTAPSPAGGGVRPAVPARPPALPASPPAPAGPPPAKPQPLPERPVAAVVRDREEEGPPAGDGSDSRGGDDDDPGPATTVATTPEELWRRLTEEVAKAPGGQAVAAPMKTVRPVSFLGGILVVGVGADVPAELAAELQQPTNLRLLEACFARVSPVPHGRVLLKRWVEGLSDDPRKSARVSTPEVRARVEKDVFVQEVCRLFAGKVIDVRG